jgi:hypothetical protein
MRGAVRGRGLTSRGGSRFHLRPAVAADQREVNAVHPLKVGLMSAMLNHQAERKGMWT